MSLSINHGACNADPVYATHELKLGTKVSSCISEIYLQTSTKHLFMVKTQRFIVIIAHQLGVFGMLHERVIAFSWHLASWISSQLLHCIAQS